MSLRRRAQSAVCSHARTLQLSPLARSNDRAGHSKRPSATASSAHAARPHIPPPTARHIEHTPEHTAAEAVAAVAMAEYADDQYAHGQQYADDQAYPTQEFAPQDKYDAHPHTQHREQAGGENNVAAAVNWSRSAGVDGGDPAAAADSSSARADWPIWFGWPLCCLAARVCVCARVRVVIVPSPRR